MKRSLLLLFSILFLAACSDAIVGGEHPADESPTTTTTSATRHEDFSKFRHTQLFDRALGKHGDVASKVDFPTINLFIGFDEYEMNGVSRRVLDEYGITRRVLDEYGITRRVLDTYGITRRILQDYGITRRVLNEYGDVVSEEPAIRARTAYGRAVQGVAVEVELEFLDALLAQLQADDEIDFIEPDPVYEIALPTILPDPLVEGEMVPWGVERMGALLTDFDGGDIHVVMMDSGVNESDDLGIDRERDISMLFRDRDREYWDDAEFQQAQPAFDPEEEGDPRDHTGHGTHMASTIGADLNGSGMRGVAPGVRTHNLRVMSDEGRTDITTLTAAIDHITWFKTDLKPDLKLVVNMSLGGDIESTEWNALDIAVQRAIDAGIVVVVAAGNDGRDASTYSPAHVDDAITVGAFDPFDGFAPYSNYGSAVDILAPGSDVVGLDSNGELSSMDGTSAAAAHVTGAVAHYWNLNPDATPLEIRDALVESAQPVVSGTPGGTTNRAVFIGEFAREWENDEPFEADGAEWDPATGTLAVQGVGVRLTTVDIYRAFTGEHLGSAYIGYGATWEFEKAGLDPVPCDVRVTSGDVSWTVEVSDAPDGCEQTPEFLGAEFKDGEILIEATGTAGYPVMLTNTNTDGFSFTGTFDSNGELFGSFSDYTKIPCSITLTAGPFSASLPLDGAPLNCDGMDYVFLKKAQYAASKSLLKVEGIGLPGALGTPLEIRYSDGEVITELYPDSNGVFKLEKDDLPASAAPCSVHAGFGDGPSVASFELSGSCWK